MLTAKESQRDARHGLYCILIAKPHLKTTGGLLMELEDVFSVLRGVNMLKTPNLQESSYKMTESHVIFSDGDNPGLSS